MQVNENWIFWNCFVSKCRLFEMAKLYTRDRENTVICNLKKTEQNYIMDVSKSLLIEN